MDRTARAAALALAIGAATPALAAVEAVMDSSTPFTNLYAEELADACDREGMTLHTQSAEQSAQLQLRLVEQALQGAPEALIVNLVDPAEAGHIAAQAKERGVPLIFCHRSPPQELLSSGAALYVGADEGTAGKEQGFALAKLLDSHPELDHGRDRAIHVLLLKGTTGAPEVPLRTQGALGLLRMCGYNPVILDEADLNWDRAMAKEFVGAFLSANGTGDLEAIIANNDEMALGAVEALNEAGSNLGTGMGPELPVLGIDGIPEAIEAVAEGRMQVTIHNNIARQAEVAARMAAQCFRKERVTARSLGAHLQGQAVMVPYTEVTQSTSRFFLDR
ncbi:MAG: substrate-binding domain-containing protein [Succinivibrionaceae bacterium]|nr:substrate-binding domain-containing protein [Succinivibrionaceae bacterium]